MTVVNNETKDVKRKRRRGAKARLLSEQRKEGKINESFVKKIEKSNYSATISNPSSISTNKKETNIASNSVNADKISKKSKKKNRNVKKKIPKPGEKGYLTPTQLRNARKRRAKQSIQLTLNDTMSINDKQNVEGDVNNGIKIHLDDGINKLNTNTKKKNVTESISFSKQDPSMRYIKKPRKAPTVKAAINFFQAHPIFQKTKTKKTFSVIMGPLFRWRTVSKLAVRKSKNGKVLIGLFAPKTHSILPVPNCPAHHPSINHATNAIQNACEFSNVQAYDEQTGKGNLRYVCVNVERQTGKSQITLVWNSNHSNEEEKQNDTETLENFTKKIIQMGTINDSSENKVNVTNDSFSLHSLWVHKNASWRHSNAIFDISSSSSNTNDTDADNVWRRLYGPDVIEECIMPLSTAPSKTNGSPIDCSHIHPPYTVKLQFPPNVFRQANIDAFAKIVQRIRERVISFNAMLDKSTSDHKNDNEKMNSGKEKNKSPMCSSILELYGGVGTIGLHLADLTTSIVCSDENPHNPKSFNAAVSQYLPSFIAKRCTYIDKNASDMIALDSGSYLKNADVIIVDPPRKGLEAPVVDALISKSKMNSNSPNDVLTKLLIYVSCGFDAFQLNCKRLEEEGNWKLEHAEGHILFPGSDAIETLAFFTC